MELGWFRELKRETNGMLSPQQYRELHRYGHELSDYNMLEIGAAHGSASIALATGIKAAGADRSVYAFERGKGGSRAQFGDKSDNIRILKENLREYDVEDHVEIIPRGLSLDDEISDTVAEAAPFSVLLHDADARLYRDFKLFYDMLLPGGMVFVDDCSCRERKGKNYEAFGYVSHFVKHGYLIKVDEIGDFFVGMKPLDCDTIDVNLKEIEGLQRRMEPFADSSRFVL